MDSTLKLTYYIWQAPQSDNSSKTKDCKSANDRLTVDVPGLRAIRPPGPRHDDSPRVMRDTPWSGGRTWSWWSVTMSHYHNTPCLRSGQNWESESGVGAGGHWPGPAETRAIRGSRQLEPHGPGRPWQPFTVRFNVFIHRFNENMNWIMIWVNLICGNWFECRITAWNLIKRSIEKFKRFKSWQRGLSSTQVQNNDIYCFKTDKNI